MIYLVVGRREQGKSTLGLYLANARPDAHRVLVDPRSQFAQLSDEQILETPTLAEINEHASIIVRLNRVEEDFAWLMKNVRHLVATTPHVKRTLLLDEGRFLDLRNDDLDWIMRCAPRDVVDIIITAHRPSDFPVDVRAIADYWCIFSVTQEHDLGVIEDRCGTHARDQAQRLPPRHYLVWDDGRAQLSRCSAPARWHVSMRPALPGEPPPAVKSILTDVTDTDDDLWTLK